MRDTKSTKSVKDCGGTRKTTKDCGGKHEKSAKSVKNCK